MTEEELKEALKNLVLEAGLSTLLSSLSEVCEERGEALEAQGESDSAYTFAKTSDRLAAAAELAEHFDV